MVATTAFHQTADAQTWLVEKIIDDGHFDRVIVAVQLRDGDGNTDVLDTGLVVTLAVAALKREKGGEKTEPASVHASGRPSYLPEYVRVAVFSHCGGDP